MKEKWMNAPRFRKAVLIYALVLIAAVLAAWLLAYQYAVCYEEAQPAGAMNAYLEETLTPALEQQVAQVSEEYASEYQSAEEISAVLTEAVLQGKWSYREDSKQSTHDAPIYGLRCNGVQLAQAQLTKGEPRAISFGLTPWEVSATEANLLGMSRSITVVAPTGSAPAVNGVTLTAPVSQATAKQYPLFDEFAGLITVDMGLETFAVPNLFIEAAVTAGEGFTVLETEDPNVYYVLPVCDEATATEVLDYAEEFVGVYFQYTSNATSIYHLQRYVHLHSELYQRIYKSMDGMSWVSGVTGKLTELELRDFVFYGNTATVEADYLLDMKKIDDRSGSMHIVLAKGTYNWRVVTIEMY